MPAYSFEALDAQGETRRGVMEADTAKAVRSLLRAQSLVPLQVPPVSSGVAANEQSFGWSQRAFSRAVFTSTGLAIWTRQLAGLITSGLPLERALTALTDEAGERARAPPGGRAARRSQRRLVVRQGAGPVSARVSRHLHRGDRRRRAKRQPRPGAGAAGRRPGGAAGAAGAAAGRRAVPRHRHRRRHRDRAVPGGLRGAAGGQRVRRQQARAALPHGGHAGDQRLRAQLGLAGLAAAGGRHGFRRGWRCATKPRASASMRPG